VFVQLFNIFAPCFIVTIYRVCCVIQSFPVRFGHAFRCLSIACMCNKTTLQCLIRSSSVYHWYNWLVAVSMQTRSTRCGHARRMAVAAHQFVYPGTGMTNASKTTSSCPSTVRSRATAGIGTNATILKRHRLVQTAKRRWGDRPALLPRR